MAAISWSRAIAFLGLLAACHHTPVAEPDDAEPPARGFLAPDGPVVEHPMAMGGANYAYPVGPATGDLGGTYPAPTVAAISGSTPIAVTPNTLRWVTGATGPTLSQASESTATKGADFTITPQTSTHATDQGGGNLLVSLETPTGAGVEAFLTTMRGAAITTQLGPLVGTPADGAVYLGAVTPSASNYSLYGDATNLICNAPSGAGAVAFRLAGATKWQLNSTTTAFGIPAGGITGGNAFSWAATSVALTSGASNVLTNAQYFAPHIKFTGTLTGAGTTITFPATDGACWDLDFSAIVTIADSIALIANSNTWSVAVASTATEYPHICYSAGAGKLVGTSMIQ